MVKVFLIAIGIAIMSSSFFPFVFTFFPFANTKMILAFCGLILYFFRLASYGQSFINRESLVLTICALGVSFASLGAMIWNDTTDGTYLTYIISMWVWLGAAYFTVSILKQIHGRISVELVCCYMVAVGALQCIIALAIDMNPSVEHFVSLFLEGEGFMGKKEGRLHGIGCSTDVGGSRLAALLIINVFLMFVSLKYKKYLYRLFLLIASFLIIAVLGNMIARTTTVGLVLSVCLFLYLLFIENGISYAKKKLLLKIFMSGVILCVLLFSILSATNNQWSEHLRFGFEGFYSLVETGSWQVKSNDMLMEGFIYPDNLKTWIIGDGYMGDPHNNPYYIGPESWGFYMNTDAGYSRFIFYFGLIGLGTFMFFFMKVCQTCINRFNEYRMMFLFILVLNFCVWIKVTTDIFMIFAPFLCVSAADNEDSEMLKLAKEE